MNTSGSGDNWLFILKEPSEGKPKADDTHMSQAAFVQKLRNTGFIYLQGSMNLNWLSNEMT